MNTYRATMKIMAHGVEEKRTKDFQAYNEREAKEKAIEYYRWGGVALLDVKIKKI